MYSLWMFLFFFLSLKKKKNSAHLHHLKKEKKRKEKIYIFLWGGGGEKKSAFWCGNDRFCGSFALVLPKIRWITLTLSLLLRFLPKRVPQTDRKRMRNVNFLECGLFRAGMSGQNSSRTPHDVCLAGGKHFPRDVVWRHKGGEGVNCPVFVLFCVLLPHMCRLTLA